MATKLTEHFTLEELTTTSRMEFIKQNYDEGAAKYGGKLLNLAIFGEQVRRLLHCAMTVTSAYRCEALNKAIGGSKTSQHLVCEAIDFIPMAISAKEAFDIIRASKLEYGQLILEKRGAGHIVHVSIGTKRENLYSPEQGKYMEFQEVKNA